MTDGSQRHLDVLFGDSSPGRSSNGGADDAKPLGDQTSVVSAARIRLGVGAAILGSAALIGMVLLLQTGAPDRIIADSWRRAIDADPNIVHVFERNPTGQATLHPTSSVDTGRPLVVGDRVMLVTPDGAIHAVRVCDPASANAATAPDCLNNLVARAITPAAAPPPQRSL